MPKAEIKKQTNRKRQPTKQIHKQINSRDDYKKPNPLDKPRSDIASFLNATNPKKILKNPTPQQINAVKGSLQQLQNLLDSYQDLLLDPQAKLINLVSYFLKKNDKQQ